MSRKHQRRLRELADSHNESRTPRYIAGEDDVGPILSWIAFLLVSLVALVVVLAGAVFFGTRQIEASLESSALRHLQRAGYEQVGVEASGRVVTLRGQVPNDEALEVIPAAVSRIDGVRAVESDLSLETPDVEPGNVPSDPLQVVWSPDGLVVTGTVSTEDIREFVVTELNDRFETVDDSGLVVRERVADETEWIGDVIAVADGLSQATPAGNILVNPGEGLITVAAEFPDRQVRADKRTEAEDILAGGPLQFISGLTVEDAPPPPEPEEVEELQVDLDDLIAGKVVEFELNSAALTRRGTRLLDQVTVAMERVPDVAVEIGGHADAQGDADDNQRLSERRARSVRSYLVDQGIDPDRLVVIGYGETRPIADNSTAEGRARNRRIEFTALDD